MSPASKEKEDILLKLEGTIQEVARNISIRIFQHADQILTHPQYFMLKKIASGPVSVSEVADHLGVSLSAVTSMADRMVNSGYISRYRSEKDRRLVRLELTAAGASALTEAESKRREVIHGIIGRLPREDLESLHGIYTKILGLIRQSGQD